MSRSSFSVAQLVEIGFTKEQAKKILALPPVERVDALPIVGNAWSDGPLFEAIRETIMDPTLPARRKVIALKKSHAAVGSQAPLLILDDELAQELSDYADNAG